MVKGVLYTVTSLGQIAAINPGDRRRRSGSSIPATGRRAGPATSGYVHRGTRVLDAIGQESKERLLLGTQRRVSDLGRCEDRRARHVIRRGRPRRPDGRRSRTRCARTNYSVTAAPVDLPRRRRRRRQHSRRPDAQGMAARRRQRLRRAHRQEAVDAAFDSAEGRVRQRDVGRRFVRPTPAAPTCGPTCRPTRSSATSTCRSARPPTTSTAAIVRARTCLPKAWSRSTRRPASASWHFQAVHHGVWDYDFPGGADPGRHHASTASRSRPSRRSASRASPTCSIAGPARRCGRSKSGRCRSRRCPASARRRRSRSRPSRRRSSGRA